jgi:adenine phosphoribosyltransferase
LGYGFRKTIDTHNGVPFLNCAPLYADYEQLNTIVDILIRKLTQLNTKITHVLALESGGYILGMLLACKMNLSLVQGRKPGKLPKPVVSSDYSMEYREQNSLEIQQDAFSSTSHVVVIDDIIATGGTINCGVELVRKLGGTPVAVAAFADLIIHTRQHIDVPCITYAQIHDNQIIIN